MTALTFEKTKHGYAALWDKSHITNVAGATSAAAALSDPGAMKLLKYIEKKTGVPWFFTGATLYREAPLKPGGKLNFDRYLGNGQLLSQRTTIVPIGRGPFTEPNAFYNGAVDTYEQQEITGKPVGYWTLERCLYAQEHLNGTGYFDHDVNSPYLWNYTDLYTSGYYTSDHGFDKDAVDKHSGVAAIWKIMEAQGLITFTRETAVAAPVQPLPVPQPRVPPMPTPVQPAPQFDIASIEAALQSFQAVLPMVGMWLPAPLKPFVAAFPVVLDVAQMVRQIQQSDKSAAAIGVIVATHLHTIADKLKAVIPTPQQVQQIAAQAPVDRAAGAPS